MNLDLKNKHAIVCGSTQGIGKAVALELALLGANVTLVARNEYSLKKVKDSLKIKPAVLKQTVATKLKVNQPGKNYKPVTNKQSSKQ